MLSVLIWWIIVGLIAGWGAGKIMKGRGYGPLMDIALGMVGAHRRRVDFQHAGHLSCGRHSGKHRGRDRRSHPPDLALTSAQTSLSDPIPQTWEAG